MHAYFGGGATAHHEFLAWLLKDEAERSCRFRPAIVACRAVADLHGRAARGDFAPPGEWDAASAAAGEASWDAMVAGLGAGAWFAAAAAEWSAMNAAARDAADEARDAAASYSPRPASLARVADKIAELTAARRADSTTRQRQS